MSTLDDLVAEAANLKDRVDSFCEALADATSAKQVEANLLDSIIADLEARKAALVGWVPTEKGDWATARGIARWQGHDKGYTWGEQATTDWLLTGPGPFTAEQMTAVYGPQWTHVVALVRSAASKTPDELQRYRKAFWSLYDSDPDVRRSYNAVVVDYGPCDAARRALWAVVDYVYYAAVGSALARRHEVATSDYDRITGAWRRMFGPIHPDDEVLS